MPCMVKCRCGKGEQLFRNLNPGDIDFYECDECPSPEESSQGPEECESDSQDVVPDDSESLLSRVKKAAKKRKKKKDGAKKDEPKVEDRRDASLHDDECDPSLES